ncbi:hypothetical protein [Nocardia sp. NPDC004860]|uniref:hypothetical protein n=1 Tax=Nocardia sp. NPDC004860 TaxID=3154557 RepID=UPI0033A826A5
MRSRRLSRDELPPAFEAALASALRGELLPTSTGLSSEIEDLMWDIADAHPAVPQRLIDQARAALDRQINQMDASSGKA